jgi:hypothetical protein
MLPEAMSEALGISLSEVLALYFGEHDDIRRGRMIGDAIDRHRDSEEEQSWFEESWQRREEAERRSYYKDAMF